MILFDFKTLLVWMSFNDNIKFYIFLLKPILWCSQISEFFLASLFTLSFFNHWLFWQDYWWKKKNMSDHECRDLTSPRGKQAFSEPGWAQALPGQVEEAMDSHAYSFISDESEDRHRAGLGLTGGAAESMRSPKTPTWFFLFHRREMEHGRSWEALLTHPLTQAPRPGNVQIAILTPVFAVGTFLHQEVLHQFFSHGEWEVAEIWCIWNLLSNY
jgi:hypothetical protein